MKHLIHRGTTFIGSITCPSESGGTIFGMEVLFESAFPGVDPDADNQAESFESAERYLQRVYEAHCAANGLVALPMPAAPEETDPAADYYAREAAREAAEIADHDAAIDAEVAHMAAIAAEESLTEAPAAFRAHAESDGSDDDLPF